MELKDRIKIARKHAGLTQLQLAERAGLDQTSISNLERGKSQGSSFTAQIASVCGVSAIWLAGGKGEMTVFQYEKDLSRIADEVEDAVGLKSIPGPEMKAHVEARTAEKLAKNLTAIASPRSALALKRIIDAASSGDLSEKDLVLLETIAEHITKGPSPEGPNSRISRMIKNAAKDPDRG